LYLSSDKFEPRTPSINFSLLVSFASSGDGVSTKFRLSSNVYFYTLAAFLGPVRFLAFFLVGLAFVSFFVFLISSFGSF